MPKISKILVVRNDKIGDFVLALPAIQAIKKAFPLVKITALVPNYTKEIASAFSWIDEVIIDSKKEDSKKALVQLIKEQSFDAVICFFSDRYNATLVRQAQIPIRVAPATKWVQILYTHTLRQRRSQSLKPEFEYNLDLANYFIDILGGQIRGDLEPMFHYSDEDLSNQLTKLAGLGIAKENKFCFIHPVTGGSSSTLMVDQWAALIVFLDSIDDFYFVITAGPNEAPISQAVVDAVKNKVSSVRLYDKNDGVADFMCSIATADLFIAGSTGPLHIAGALDIPTIGFYPKKRSATPLRWKTLNTEGRWLSLSPNEDESLLVNMDVARNFPVVESWYRNLTRKG
ncbi:glycosyltransferase family 9 protein [Marinomonas flavescens]|uniref:glycosyltransferase family 9 protein n=1 Tax=Marinomonas flavescens TaxID=2529379 RepID=UPI001A9E0AB7|nr:glycosyltransferase family 9 protein [Marinomonas flavescens]